MTKPVPKRKPTSPEAASDYAGLVGGISELVGVSRRTSVCTVNASMTATYCEVGRRIVEFEQSGEKRVEYGQTLLIRLADDLAAHHGRGFSVDNLENMRLFHGFCGSPEISETLSRKCQTPSGESAASEKRAIPSLESKGAIRPIAPGKSFASLFKTHQLFGIGLNGVPDVNLTLTA